MYTVKEDRSLTNKDEKKLYKFELEVSFNEQLRPFPNVCKRAYDSLAIHLQNCYREDLKAFESLSNFVKQSSIDKNGNSVFKALNVIKFSFDEIDGLKRGKQNKSTREQVKSIETPQEFYDVLIFAQVPNKAAIATTIARFNLKEFTPSE